MDALCSPDVSMCVCYLYVIIDYIFVKKPSDQELTFIGLGDFLEQT